MSKKELYVFRPFELQRIEYKNYSTTAGYGNGIILYPKARSGHRIAVNDIDIFCFGGKWNEAVALNGTG